MGIPMKRRALLAWPLTGTLGPGIWSPRRAHAQTPAMAAPRAPVEWTLPFRLSGPLVRHLLDQIGSRLPAGHLIDERSGANGSLAIRHALQDHAGATRVLVSTTSTTFFSALFPGSETFVRSQVFSGLGRMAEVPLVLVARAALADRIGALRRWEPQAYRGLSMATSPPPGFLYFAAHLLEEITATPLLKVPYPGGFILPVIKGEVDLAMLPLDGAIASIDSGQALPVAVAAGQRLGRLDKVPTFRELGRDLVLKVSYDLLVGAAWQRPEMRFMNQALNQVLADEALRTRCASQGLQLAPPQTLAEHERVLREEDAFWAPRIQAFGRQPGALPSAQRPREAT